MSTQSEFDSIGVFDARYRAFLEAVADLRPSLHRYCARMTGSVMDGEDVAQEALFEAYRKLDQFDGSRPLKPWVFAIAHNRCIDLLRKRTVRVEAETAAAQPESVEPPDPAAASVRPALERLVTSLPPKERACVLLKDIFDYSLEEIAELVDSSVGGVKAALNRGRTKLAGMRESPPGSRSAAPETSRLLQLYVERFNRQDWDGVRALTSADARLLVGNGFSGRLADSPYFTEYERTVGEWRMSLGDVDGEPAVISLRREDGGWRPRTIVRVEVADGRIVRIADYVFCEWLLPAAGSFAVAPAA
ncbi:MAG TPA: sigma-70 family RNA polymerase sigma factor [Xanthobacteraceae bacterium]|nr:sigma-70 family RNA polymerase sigma factor [Xanthobacteraceae bacterium]